ncbi:S41 family peptidase [Thalassotalea sp. PP2-459]|uniref:S41 family peptidase n=1 Tax=Thalassotalea sp. PP2-459 TaxID=1742724 RepID=UPI0009439D5D|nr:S41 family peptidase [Thalassotalea sp. PP2-459]OKY26517.1 hypothetical protein BI291_11905 [Thalassotalea sp. PP2-459]
MKSFNLNLIYVLALFTQVFVVHAAEFPTKHEREAIVESLLNGIESVDGVTIELRDSTRVVKWDNFKKIATRNVVSASDWSSLYSAINNIHDGIINRHSYIQVEEGIRKHVKAIAKWPRYKLGYTWPNITFFDLDNKQTILSLNGTSVIDLFDEFFNLYCNDVHDIGCLKLFSVAIGRGYRFKDNAEKLDVTFKGGSKKQVLTPQKLKKIAKKGEPKQCENLYTNLPKNLVFKGDQSCLFEIDNHYLLKIRYFGRWGTEQNDIYCQKVTTEGMCSDILAIKNILSQQTAKPLIIDLQNNGGGSENTPWIAALTTNGFMDNVVLYRSLALLKDKDIRKDSFYDNEYAENWYQKIKVNMSEQHKYLPPRADFCRGSKECALENIPSAKLPIKYRALTLVINETCVSSCDDFVWRTRRYAQAKTVGQLPATDGAYARIKGYIYVDKQGNIGHTHVGESQDVPAEAETLLVSYRMPISKTIDVDGNNLDGADNVLDVAIPITKENYTNIEDINVKFALGL